MRTLPDRLPLLKLSFCTFLKCIGKWNIDFQWFIANFTKQNGGKKRHAYNLKALLYPPPFLEEEKKMHFVKTTLLATLFGWQIVLQKRQFVRRHKFLYKFQFGNLQKQIKNLGTSKISFQKIKFQRLKVSKVDHILLPAICRRTM